jgi:hypothetical protein
MSGRKKKNPSQRYGRIQFSPFLSSCLPHRFSILDENRHFLLSNGSLLIVNSKKSSDMGKYRCNATNQFARKTSRNAFSMLTVISRTDNNDNHGSSLLPPLQSLNQKIKSGQNLILHCASHTNKVSHNRFDNRGNFFIFPQTFSSSLIKTTDFMDIHAT